LFFNQVAFCKIVPVSIICLLTKQSAILMLIWFGEFIQKNLATNLLISVSYEFEFYNRRLIV
jgi:hypothetical protein